MGKHAWAYAVFIVVAVLTVGQSLSFLLGSGDGGIPAEEAAREPVGAVVMQLVTTGLLVVLFLGCSVGLPRIAGWALNIPNKDYWLAPERQEQTYGYLVPWFLWFGSLNLLLMLVIFRQAHLARLGQDGAGPWVGLLGYIVASMVFVVHMLWRFGSTTQSKDT